MAKIPSLNSNMVSRLWLSIPPWTPWAFPPTEPAATCPLPLEFLFCVCSCSILRPSPWFSESLFSRLSRFTPKLLTCDIIISSGSGLMTTFLTCFLDLDVSLSSSLTVSSPCFSNEVTKIYPWPPGDAKAVLAGLYLLETLILKGLCWVSIGLSIFYCCICLLIELICSIKFRI